MALLNASMDTVSTPPSPAASRAPRTTSKPTTPRGSAALKETYRTILTSGVDVTMVYLQAEPELVRSRLDSRKGHYMPKQLIESQFLALEEPKQAIVIDAGWPSEKAVTAIRSRLGK